MGQVLFLCVQLSECTLNKGSGSFYKSFKTSSTSTSSEPDRSPGLAVRTNSTESLDAHSTDGEGSSERSFEEGRNNQLSNMKPFR